MGLRRAVGATAASGWTLYAFIVGGVGVEARRTTALTAAIDEQVEGGGAGGTDRGGNAGETVAGAG